MELTLPFDGWWRVVRGPGDRVPSHGTDRFGLTYAYDFVATDEQGRTRSLHRWRRWWWTEAVEAFAAFGRPVCAPVGGRVVVVHDGEPDGRAHRAPIAQLGLLFSQAKRLRSGHDALAGNHVIVQGESDSYVVLAHLRRGSISVRPGDLVSIGHRLGECGNSGNSTEPHLHLQVMDSADASSARGLPVLFVGYEMSSDHAAPRPVAAGLPRAGESIRRG